MKKQAKEKTIKTMVAFKRAYPVVTCEDVVILSSEASKAARRIVKLHAMIAALAKQEDSLKVLIALEIKGHAQGDAGLYNIHMPTVTTEKLDTETLQDEEEEICNKYMVISQTRKFDLRVKAAQ